jgi:ABC-type iron transport system FetAB ATPase subunit
VSKARGFQSLLSAVQLLETVQEKTSSASEAIGAGARFPERRSVPRYALRANAHIIEPVAGSEFTCRSSEVSIEGCRVELSDLLPQGSLIGIRTLGDHQTFETSGTIIHARPEHGTGVAFFEPASEQKAIVTRSIAELNGGENSEESRIALNRNKS